MSQPEDPLVAGLPPEMLMKLEEARAVYMDQIFEAFKDGARAGIDALSAGYLAAGCPESIVEPMREMAKTNILNTVNERIKERKG